MVTFTPDKTYGFKLNPQQLEKLTANLGKIPGLENADDTKQLLLKLAEIAAGKGGVNAGVDVSGYETQITELQAQKDNLSAEITRLQGELTAADIAGKNATITDLTGKLSEVESAHKAAVEQHIKNFNKKTAEITALKEAAEAKLQPLIEKLNAVKAADLRQREKDIINGILR